MHCKSPDHFQTENFTTKKYDLNFVLKITEMRLHSKKLIFISEYYSAKSTITEAMAEKTQYKQLQNLKVPSSVKEITWYASKIEFNSSRAEDKLQK